MSYHPAHYQPPPQGRWPQATPPEAWPSYQDGDVYRDREYAGGQSGASRQGGYPPASGHPRQPGGQRVAGRAAGDSFDGGGYGYRGSPDGYAGTTYAGTGYVPATRGYADERYDWSGGYRTVTDGFDGAPATFMRPVGYPRQDEYPGRYGYPRQDEFPGRGDFPGQYGYAGQDEYPGLDEYPGRDGYAAAGTSGGALAAPDAGLDPVRWRAEQDRRREASRRGLAVGAVTGLLAVAVATGVSTLAAAFVRPAAAPVTALGDVFVDRVPAALRSQVVAHFGSHGRPVLLLGMYLLIAGVALVMGALSRRTAAAGVLGLTVLTLLSAFVVITRPEGQMTDVVPAAVGGAAGAAALLWLKRASAPGVPVVPAHGRRSR